MTESFSEETAEQEFKITDLFRLYKAANELVHSDDTPDLEAPVKFITQSGDEFLITTLKQETNPETNETVIWLEGVIDE